MTEETATAAQGAADILASNEDPAGLLVFNGIDATTGEYLLPAMNMQQLARVATGDRLAGDEFADLQHKSRHARQANFAVVEGIDPNDLAQAGWAAVFSAVAHGSDAAARQAAILDALAPLLSHRRAQASAIDNLYHEYIGDRGYRAGETKQQYLARLGAGPGPVQPRKVPYYLLLVATPEEIPYRIQYQLDVHYAVGRIAFDTIDEYAHYARSVVEAETGQVTRRRRATFFGVANPNDAATRLSADHLVSPLVAHVEGRHAHHGFTVDSYLGSAATRGRLIELLRDPPALLFTASHGVGYPCGDVDQRERQGALLCQDWAGPGNPVAREHYFTGEDLPIQADLRGMIGVLFACYGGGTPTRDEFTRRSLGEARARELAPAPLIARLPLRMLGHPGGGALAVVGHVDRAWGSTFLWVDAQRKGQTQKHLDVFESMLDGVLAGKRLGYAMESFNLRYAELASDLSERIEQIQLYDEPYEDSELAHMWICNNDARNYAVIGDPAVRIPDTRGTGDTAQARAIRDPIAREVAPTPLASDGADDKHVAPTVRELGSGGDVPGAQRELPSFGWFGSKDDAEPGLFARLGQKLGDMLGNVVSDVTVLEIRTYTSDDLQVMANGASLPASGARLRAYTRCKLDGDTDACVPLTATGAVNEALWALHVEMVKQAQTHRAELLKTVLSLFSLRAGK
jgi:hypothetical protein